jgi:hypothetical protein
MISISMEVGWRDGEDMVAHFIHKFATLAYQSGDRIVVETDFEHASAVIQDLRNFHNGLDKPV